MSNSVGHSNVLSWSFLGSIESVFVGMFLDFF